MRAIGILTICISLSVGAGAQSDLQNNGLIFVSGLTDTLYINGAFSNASGAALTNNGQLYVRQNLTNNQAAMTIGTGNLLLTGTALQTIGGAQVFRTFDLVTNNSAGILLNNNLDVSGTHTFISGAISSSATPNYLVYQSGASHTGASDNAHVSGWVKRLGSTNFTYPVGNGTVLRGITLTALSASSEFNVRHNINTPNTTSVLSPIMSVDPYEYWTVNQVSGGTAQLLMNWDKSRINFPSYILADIRAVYNNAGVWTNRGGTASGNVNTTGTITSNAVSAFGNFTMGSITFVLPLNFVGIWGLPEQGYNLIQWKTAAEYDVDHFEIQRSGDGVNYQTIARRPATNTNAVHSYEYMDNALPPGDSWYRVVSVDLNGDKNISSVVLIAASGRGNSFRLVNHIVTNTVHLAISEKYKGNYTYQLVNQAGQLVLKGRLAVDHSGTFAVPIGNLLLKGTYIFRLYNTKNSLVDKITIR